MLNAVRDGYETKGAALRAVYTLRNVHVGDSDGQDDWDHWHWDPADEAVRLVPLRQALWLRGLWRIFIEEEVNVWMFDG